MSNYGQPLVGYSNKKINSNQRIRKATKMKMTLKQKFRNWLNSDLEKEDVPQLCVESNRLDSEGLRLQVYKASGGYVVETRSYDRQKDRSYNSMHVITEDQDLGDALGKIVMVEALRS